MSLFDAILYVAIWSNEKKDLLFIPSVLLVLPWSMVILSAHSSNGMWLAENRCMTANSFDPIIPTVDSALALAI